MTLCRLWFRGGEPDGNLVTLWQLWFRGGEPDGNLVSLCRLWCRGGEPKWRELKVVEVVLACDSHQHLVAARSCFYQMLTAEILVSLKFTPFGTGPVVAVHVAWESFPSMDPADSAISSLLRQSWPKTEPALCVDARSFSCRAATTRW